jgi:hypothetical protein
MLGQFDERDSSSRRGWALNSAYRNEDQQKYYGSAVPDVLDMHPAINIPSWFAYLIYTEVPWLIPIRFVL